MYWAAHAATGTTLSEVLDPGLDELSSVLPDGRADLVFLFLGAAHAPEAAEALAEVRRRLGSPHVLGCGAGGVIGGAKEYEQVPAVSMLAGRLPGAAVHGFHLRDEGLPDADAPPKAWHEAVGTSSVDAPSFVVVADPFTVRPERLLAGLDFAYPGAVKIGGLASAASRPGQQALIHGDRVVREGTVGVALMGDVELVPAVAQGCLGLGPPMHITACDGHLLRGLDGKEAIEALREVIVEAPERARALAQHALFLGFEMDPLEAAGERPWLIRNLLGVDPGTRGIFVAERLRPGRRVRFYVRDRQTSSEDLGRVLDDASAVEEVAPEGALLFSCLGRGRHLYGTPDHDASAFGARFTDVPLAGFFANGEIGPVGRWTYVHGYTSAFGLIRPRSGS